jgi:hypothetical protein
METSIYAISSSLISATIGNEGLINFFINYYKKYKYKSRVYGLILFKGVSHLCDHLKSPDLIFIDLDRLYQNLNLKEASDISEPNTTENLLSYHIIKNHILNILTIYKKKVVLVSKDYNLIKTMPIKDYNIFFSCFSKEADVNLRSIYKDDKEHNDSIINKFRLLRLNEIKEENIFYCNSLKELYDKLIIKFDLPKINL